MKAPPVRVGVVGTGALGYHHARLMRRLAGADLVGIYDINPARASQVAHELETTAFPSLEALLAQAEAVTVAVPTPAHVSVGLAVLECGRALLMEKPLADSVAGAEELVRRAAAAKLLLQVGHVERFNRAVRAAAPYLEEPRFLQTDRLAPFQPRGTDVAVILDLMIHDLDLVLELVRSEVTEVRATGVALLTPHVDIANARVEFANGAVANVTASRCRGRTRKLRVFQPRLLSLEGLRGVVLYRLKHGCRTRRHELGDHRRGHVRRQARGRALRLELESFRARCAVRGPRW